jgi:hypothetical protein
MGDTCNVTRLTFVVALVLALVAAVGSRADAAKR